ncbi:serine/arginine repetitive matrix protein 1-like [Penaeus japonicus]|uniref:serine/arginine repetitive matrix protein 1-like n=1 Tax=Penaeus japonicus TaxID=27405 RepID=UPI001C7144B2|nr:serine/arginine repetitive matrix protein 1-like [Penaeus japonicus]
MKGKAKISPLSSLSSELRLPIKDQSSQSQEGSQAETDQGHELNAPGFDFEKDVSVMVIPESRIQNPKSRIQNPEPRIQNQKSRIQNQELRTQNQEPITKNLEPGTQNQEPEPRTQNLEPRTQTQEPRTRNPNPRTQNPNPRTQSQELKTQTQEPRPRTQTQEPKNPNPRTQNPKPRTKNPEPRIQNPKPKNPKPRTKNPESQTQEPKTQNQEPKPKNQEPRTQNQKLKTQNQEPKPKDPDPRILTPERRTPHLALECKENINKGCGAGSRPKGRRSSTRLQIIHKADRPHGCKSSTRLQVIHITASRPHGCCRSSTWLQIIHKAAGRPHGCKSSTRLQVVPRRNPLPPPFTKRDSTIILFLCPKNINLLRPDYVSSAQDKYRTPPRYFTPLRAFISCCIAKWARGEGSILAYERKNRDLDEGEKNSAHTKNTSNPKDRTNSQNTRASIKTALIQSPGFYVRGYRSNNSADWNMGSRANQPLEVVKQMSRLE